MLEENLRSPQVRQCLASLTAALLPWALGFAGGAMLFVITSEIIPETHRGDSKREASFALLTGFLVMMMLDVALG